MFPIDWQSPAVRDLVMMAAAEGHRPASAAHAGRHPARSTLTRLRRRIGAALVIVGRRLEGGQPLDAAGRTPGLAAASGAGK